MRVAERFDGEDRETRFVVTATLHRYVATTTIEIGRRRHDREQILSAAVDYCLGYGINALTFRRLAMELEIPDRTIVYYFATKADLMDAVITSASSRLLAILEDAFGAEPLPADRLLSRAWPVLASPASDPIIAFLQFVGLTASH